MSTGNRIAGSTHVAAVVGHPVRHSLSPAIHNAAFQATGLDWVYVALDVAPEWGSRAVEAMRTLGISGMSVTMPHKSAVAAAADERTPSVERLGVANCLFWRDGAVVADSTDGDGFVAAFCQQFGDGLAHRRIGVVGAGGAARSIIEAVGRSGAQSIVVHNRSPERLASAVALAPQARPGAMADLADCEIIVNATSVGMGGGPTPELLPIDTDVIGPDHVVVDIVYNPVQTPLLAAATGVGARTQGGVGMLIHQAALAFERWTGVPAPLDAMTGAVADQIR